MGVVLKLQTRVLAAVVVTLALGQQASAAPSVGHERFVSASFVVVARDGQRFTFDLEASEVGTGLNLPSSLSLDLRRCDGNGMHCANLSHSRLPLPADAVRVSADLSAAAVSVVIGGTPISLVLQHSFVEPGGINTPGATLYTVETLSGGPSPRFDAYVEGAGSLTVNGHECASGGRIGTYQGLDRSGKDDRDPRPSRVNLDKLARAQLATATCS